MSECSKCQSLGNDSHLFHFQKEVACVCQDEEGNIVN